MGFLDEKDEPVEKSLAAIHTSASWVAHRSDQNFVLITLRDDAVMVHSERDGILLEIKTSEVPGLLDFRAHKPKAGAE